MVGGPPIPRKGESIITRGVSCPLGDKKTGETFLESRKNFRDLYREKKGGLLPGKRGKGADEGDSILDASITFRGDFNFGLGGGKGCL